MHLYMCAEVLASSEISGGDFFYDKGVRAEPLEGLRILGPAYTNASDWIISDEPNELYGPLNALLEADELSQAWFLDRSRSNFDLFYAFFIIFRQILVRKCSLWHPIWAKAAPWSIVERTRRFKSDTMKHRGRQSHGKAMQVVDLAQHVVFPPCARKKKR